MPGDNLVCPKGASFRAVPVREHGVPRPDSTDVSASIGVLEEDFIFLATGIGIIAEIGSAD